MYTKENLWQNLVDLGLKRDDTVMIHSSIKAIGPVEGGVDTVLDVLMEYFGETGLLLMPTHTWQWMEHPLDLFDPDEMPSCVGFLTEQFRKRPGVLRSLHPTHSIGAYGPRAAEYIQGEETIQTPCGAGGCWAKLSDWNAKVIFLGCPVAKNTFLHGVEEKKDVPNRLTAQPVEFRMKMPDGTIKTCKVKRHYCSEYPDISKFYGKVMPAFLKKGIAEQGKFGDAVTVVADAKGMEQLTLEFLDRNIDLFLGDQPVPESWYEKA
ncbi:MAG: AAC(3) family N-acetyltransferase [Massiliimalia sp.]